MSDLKCLSEIFQNSLFRIPDYQRGYAWQKEQLIDFWEDIVSLRENQNHYTGMLSIVKSEKSYKNDDWLTDYGYDVYNIIDGQQRLTTCIILINEIIKRVRELCENKGKKDDEIFIKSEKLSNVKEKYICRKEPPLNIITTYMFGYENDNPSSKYLKSKVLEEEYELQVEETYYTKNMQYAKDFFKKRLEDFNAANLTKLFFRLTFQLKFNIHEIEKDYDVYVAFETMNNRGKKLTNLELLKNRLIYLSTLFKDTQLDDNERASLREKINEVWKTIYHQLGRNKKGSLSDDEFLKGHWSYYYKYSRQGKNQYINFLLHRFSQKSVLDDYVFIEDESDNTTPVITDEQIEETYEDDYQEVNESVEEDENVKITATDVFNYVMSLGQAAEPWYYSFYPDDNPNFSVEEKVWIGKINKVGINYFRPLLVVVQLLPNTTVEERLKLYKAIERFIFVIFRLGGMNGTHLNSKIYKMNHELYNGDINITEYTSYLEEEVNNNASDMIQSFISKTNQRFNNKDGFYSWSSLKYFLYEYEFKLGQEKKIEKLDWAEFTKVVKDKTSIEHVFPQTPTKHYWVNAFRQFTDLEKKYLVNSLGNLLPLSICKNAKLQNNSFVDKKEEYKNGSLSEIEVSSYENWSAMNIYERGMNLLSFMENRWGIQFESKEDKEKLLHIGFVKDGRDIPQEIDKDSFIEISDDNKDELYKHYWTYALPKIREVMEGNPPYANVSPSNSNYLDGHFGLNGMWCVIVINERFHMAKCGFWISSDSTDKNKSVFDILYSHKDEIENKMGGISLEWDRKDDRKSSSIVAVLEDISIKNQSQWEKIARFHSEFVKKFMDYAFLPYEKEIRSIL